VAAARISRAESVVTFSLYSGPVTDLDELLAGYEPGTDREAGDLARIRGLLAGGGDPWDRATPLHLTGSALVVHPPSRRVLLRWHARQQAWLQVGGHGDPGETHPLTVASREAEEETGLADLAPWPDARLLQVAVVPVAPGKGEPAHEHADLRFVLATGTPERIRPEDAAARLRWLPIERARAEVTRENLRESLSRVAELI
jgi:8-oxo-dGTP pyrophosphatase MutT (NUDIX family)